MRERVTALERILRRERRVTVAALALLCALAWLYLATGAGMGASISDTALGSLFPHKLGEPPLSTAMRGMPGMAPPFSPQTWSPDKAALAFAMWGAMMVAMMTPSAAPAILLYGRVVRHAASSPDDGARTLSPTWAFALGYVAVWIVFSGLATGFHFSLDKAGLLSHGRMGSQSRWFSAAVLAAAGIYQLTPLHAACLSHCRSPASFFTRHWRPGVAGALRLGLLHGAYCVGCCWLVMGLLFVGGVMNVIWIAALAVLILAEKVAPGGRWIARVTGAGLVVWSGATLMS